MLPETGSISMSQVNVELKKNETAVITLNDTDVRKLAGKPSGVISMNDLRGKKASEYVENYIILNKSFSKSFYDGEQNFILELPHNIISGEITLNLSGKVGGSSSVDRTYPYVKLLGKTIEIKKTSYDNETHTLQLSNVKQLDIKYHAGKGTTYKEHGNYSYFGGTMNMKISFTGEWEL